MKMKENWGCPSFRKPPHLELTRNNAQKETHQRFGARSGPPAPTPAHGWNIEESYLRCWRRFLVLAWFPMKLVESAFWQTLDVPHNAFKIDSYNFEWNIIISPWFYRSFTKSWSMAPPAQRPAKGHSAGIVVAPAFFYTPGRCGEHNESGDNLRWKTMSMIVHHWTKAEWIFENADHLQSKILLLYGYPTYDRSFVSKINGWPVRPRSQSRSWGRTPPGPTVWTYSV